MASLTVMSCSNEAKTIIITPRNSIFGIICIYIWGEQSYVDKFSNRVFSTAEFENLANPGTLFSANVFASTSIMADACHMTRKNKRALRFFSYGSFCSKGTRLFKKTIYLAGF